MEQQLPWFSTWFDSHYYHILYRSRDSEEARGFIGNLHRHLAFPKNTKCLDLACGKGRHSLYLHELGYDVLGVDLSPQSIAEAKKNESSSLRFYVQDMRALPYVAQFDLVLNLFTSFGYFDDQKENELVLHNIRKALRKDGVCVIDYLNPAFVLRTLVPKEVVIREGISFNIERYQEESFLVKRISFEDQGVSHSFFERVSLITPEIFLSLFLTFGFTVEKVYGSYELESFSAQNSPRQIFILKAV